MMGRLQFWLQGHPERGWKQGGPAKRPWVAIALGNFIADVRYWAWRLSGKEL